MFKIKNIDHELIQYNIERINSVTKSYILFMLDNESSNEEAIIMNFKLFIGSLGIPVDDDLGIIASIEKQVTGIEKDRQLTYLMYNDIHVGMYELMGILLARHYLIETKSLFNLYYKRLFRLDNDIKQFVNKCCSYLRNIEKSTLTDTASVEELRGRRDIVSERAITIFKEMKEMRKISIELKELIRQLNSMMCIALDISAPIELKRPFYSSIEHLSNKISDANNLVTGSRYAVKELLKHVKSYEELLTILMKEGSELNNENKEIYRSTL